MSTPYPKRDGFYAMKVLRALSLSMDAPDLGPVACWLLTIIATREDQLRYEQAPQFYNQHLMTTMGMSCAKQLDRARDKAEAMGWLHYERNHNRAMARYWTKIPAAEQERGQPLQADNQGSTAANVSTIRPESVPNVSRECPDSFPNSVPIPSQPSVALLPAACSLLPLATEQRGVSAPAAGAADLFRDTTEMVPKPTTPAAEPPKPKRQAPTRFTPPTVEEALAYAATISMDEDNARRWYDFHSARGWTMGKATTQMKDWRAAMRYWKSNEYPSATGGQALNPKRTGSLPYLQIATNAEWVASMADEPVYQKDLDDHLAMDELTKEMAPESWEKMKDRRATEYQEKVQKMKDREAREGKQP